MGWAFPCSAASPASWVLLDAEASPQRLLLGTDSLKIRGFITKSSQMALIQVTGLFLLAGRGSAKEKISGLNSGSLEAQASTKQGGRLATY